GLVLRAAGKAQVFNVRAQLVPANVIDLHPFGDRAVLPFPCVAVDALAFAAEREPAVPLPGRASRPHEASGSPLSACGECFLECRVAPSAADRVAARLPELPVLRAPASRLGGAGAVLDGACTLVHVASLSVGHVPGRLPPSRGRFYF